MLICYLTSELQSQKRSQIRSMLENPNDGQRCDHLIHNMNDRLRTRKIRVAAEDTVDPQNVHPANGF